MLHVPPATTRGQEGQQSGALHHPPPKPASHAWLVAERIPTDLEHFVHLLFAQIFATLLSQPRLDQIPAYPVILGENLKQNLSML